MSDITDLSEQDQALPYSDEFRMFVQDVWNTKKESTAQKRKVDTRKFLNWFEEQSVERIENLTKRKLKGYIGHLDKKEGYADETIVGYWYGARSFIRFLEEDLEMMDENPAKNVTMESFTTISLKHTQKETEMGTTDDEIFYLSTEEFESLTDQSDIVQGPTIRNRLLLRLLWTTGLRRGELVNIEYSKDIDRINREINIPAQKSELSRDVWYPSSVEPLLTRWLDDGLRRSSPHAEDSPYLFVTQKAPQMYPGTVNQIVNSAAEKAGLQETVYSDHGGSERRKITAHVLRHSYAVHCVKNGMDISFLQKLMGHEDIDTTEIYLKYSNDDIKQAANKYAPR